MASFKHLMLYAVCAFFIIPVNAQYQSSDFLPTHLSRYKKIPGAPPAQFLS
jgi:hypothetical protein